MRTRVKDIVRGIADGLSIIEEAVGPLAIGVAAVALTLAVLPW